MSDLVGTQIVGFLTHRLIFIWCQHAYLLQVLDHCVGHEILDATSKTDGTALHESRESVGLHGHDIADSSPSTAWQHGQILGISAQKGGVVHHSHDSSHKSAASGGPGSRWTSKGGKGTCWCCGACTGSWATSASARSLHEFLHHHHFHHVLSSELSNCKRNTIMYIMYI